MQEAEESLRVILMLGQAIVPAVEDIARMFVRAAGKTVGAAGSLAGEAAARLADSVDGMGRVGMVRDRAHLGAPGAATAIVDVSDAFQDRSDLSELSRLCRRAGVGFSVVRDTQTGNLGVQFLRDRDGETMDWILGTILSKYISNDEAISSVIDAVDPTAPTETFEVSGTLFRRDKTAQQLAYTAEATDQAGKSIQLTAREDGSWSVTRHGKVVVCAGEPMEGIATGAMGKGVDGAAHCAVTAMHTVRNETVANHHAAHRKALNGTSNMTSRRLIRTAIEKNSAAARQRGRSAVRTAVKRPAVAKIGGRA